MEEILASIRRIISEDEAPAAEAGPVIPESEPVPVRRTQESSSSDSYATVEASSDRATPEDYTPSFDSQPQLPPLPDLDDDDGDLELTQKVETHGDLDVLAPEPEPEPDPEPELGPLPVATLVSDHVATATALSFGALTSGLLVPRSDRTLEDVVRDLLNPLLKAWLDENLQGIVDEAVRAEVDRISRLGGR